MARVINGNIIGNVGNLNYYMRNGVNMVRKRRGKNTKRAEGGQLVNQEKLKIASRFANPLIEFIKVGYAELVKQTVSTPQNLLISQLINDAITGIYPHQQIDPSRIMVAKGSLKPAEDALVSLVGDELHFTWKVQDRGWPVASERVMMLAYVPELNEAIYNLSGIQHHFGRDMMKINLSWKGRQIETYMAFRAEASDKVSDSVYTGGIVF